jgi:hypothetical protein
MHVPEAAVAPQGGASVCLRCRGPDAYKIATRRKFRHKASSPASSGST